MVAVAYQKAKHEQEKQRSRETDSWCGLGHEC